MKEVSSICANTNYSAASKPAKTVNFTAAPQKNQTEISDTFEKQRKKSEREKNLSMALSIFMAGAFGVIAYYTIKQYSNIGKKVQKAIARDVSKEKSFKELALGKELQEQTEEVKLMIDRKDVFKDKGLNSMPPMFLYSEPGAGKNAWVYALAKDTNSKLFEVNVLKFNDMYQGQSENNILKFIENAAKEAKNNPNQTVIVYFDEMDSIAMKDQSVNSHFTNKLHNAFKTGFNQLLKIPNVQIIGSSNKASKDKAITELLDDAIINRFGKKIFIPLPNSDQLQNVIKEFFNNKITKKEYIDEKLLKDSALIKKLCDYLSKDGHHFSFRDMEDILSKAVVLSEREAKGTPVKAEHLKAAVLDKANQLNWPPSEIEAFKRTLA